MDTKVQIKGVRDGLLVTLGEDEWQKQQEALLTLIDNQLDFFKGGKLYVDVGNQILHATELSQLRDLLSERGLSLWGILSNSLTTEQTAQVLGLATKLSKPSITPSYRSEKTADTTRFTGDEAILVQRTLRSGYRVENNGHVVVIGDVNPGAEVLAGGNVIVWGRLRGVVHAGALGDEKAIVCALDLNPTQLRIAGYIAVSPQRKGKSHPEKAYLFEGRVVAEPWDQSGK